MECLQYYVLRYQARVTASTDKDDTAFFWQDESQVGSQKLVSDAALKMLNQPDEYRDLKFTICREEPWDAIPAGFVVDDAGFVSLANTGT